MQSLQDLVEAFRSRKSLALSGETDYSYRQLYDEVLSLARGFLAMGFSPGDRLMILSRSRPEWMITSLAINYAGLVDVPRGERVSDMELNYILKHSAPVAVVVEDEKLIQRVAGQKNIISMVRVNGFPSLQDVKARSSGFSGDIPRLDPDAVASHLYTSGTMGEPRGAELTHGNFVANIEASHRRLNLTADDTALSILPLWHVFERTAQYVMLYAGSKIVYSNISNFKGDLQTIRPTCVTLVPRVLEKIYREGILKKLDDKSKIQKSLFGTMVKLSAGSRMNSANPLSLLGHVPRILMEKNVFEKLRNAMGGRLRFLISGGGKLPLEIDTFFFSAGLPIVEGYGLTETSPVISARSLENLTPGNVGKPLDNLQVRILNAESGDEMANGKIGVIHVKGPSVMRGYYRNAHETEKVMKDGWFNTEDLGCIDRRGNLVITGRIKNVIVLSNGENISPELLEETLKECPAVSNAIVVGQDWKGLGALIEPDLERLEALGVNTDITDPRTLKFFKREIRNHISPLTGFREYECIKSFRLLNQPFVQGRELTDTLKPRRSVIAALYSREIDEMAREINPR